MRTWVEGKGKGKVTVCDLSTPPRMDTGWVEQRVESDQLLELEDGEGDEGDLPGYTSTPEDLRLKKVYGDWVYANTGTHLHEGIVDNEAWKGWWRDLMVILSRHYDAPSGKVWIHFIGALVEELRGVR